MRNLSLATIFAAVVVISFAATTMDTGVRLQRYVVQEIGEIIRVRALARLSPTAPPIASPSRSTRNGPNSRAS